MRAPFSITLIAIAVALPACDNDPDEAVPQVRWEKLEFPGESVVYSVTGSLDDVLLVGTLRSILRITENGTVVENVLVVNDPIATFLEQDGSLYAISNSVNYVSSDGGTTWTESQIGFTPTPSTEATNSKGVLFRQVTLFNGELVTPGLILSSTDNGTNWKNIFPEKCYIYTMYLDPADRLYLGVSGVQWNGWGFADNPEDKAVLYYTVE